MSDIIDLQEMLLLTFCLDIKRKRKSMKFNNVYFFNGTAYAGKSTLVKLLAEKYDGIAC